MSATSKSLDALCKRYPKFLHKGGLCVALVVTQKAKERGLPLDAASLRTEEHGQVAGLGKAAVQNILEAHGINKVLAEEGGRTSRGSLGLMQAYVAVLNELSAKGRAELDEAMSWWIGKVRAHFASKGPRFHFDPSRSLRENIEDLLRQAADLQADAAGTTYKGAMLQHLVGAKLDIVLGEGAIEHRGFSVADQAGSRSGDFAVGDLVIHVTTHPTEALARKCADNISAGLKPLIITVGEGVAGALFLLSSLELAERVDVLDATQFLTSNVYERSAFQPTACKATLSDLINRYNQLVTRCENDPALLVQVK